MKIKIILRSTSNLIYYNKDFFHSLYNSSFFPNLKINKSMSNTYDSRLATEKYRRDAINNLEGFGLWFYQYKTVSSFTSKYFYPSYLTIDNYNYSFLLYNNEKKIKNYFPTLWYNYLYNTISKEIRYEFLETYHFDYYWWINAAWWLDIRGNYLQWERYLYKRLKNDNWWFDMTKHHYFWEPANKRSAFHTHMKNPYGVEGFQKTSRFTLRFRKKSRF